MGDDLERFLVPQSEAENGTYELALAELSAGKKVHHWIWWIVPQLRGLGRSQNSIEFGIASLEEARAYAAHPVLGARLRACARAVLGVRGRTASELMGSSIDADKLRSSMTLFHRATDDGLFMEVLDRYFDGRTDPRTDDILGRSPDRTADRTTPPAY